MVPSVLLIIEPHAPSQRCLGRALMLARYLHARLDIICPEGSPASSPAQARRRLEEERQYIASLLQSIAAPDVDITIDTAAGPLPAMIAAKSREKHSALVIKAPWNRQTSDPMDWQLMRNCPVPLMLTGGKPWHPRARLLAAINVARECALGKNHAVLEAATALQRACGADLELAFVDTRVTAGPIPERAAEELDRLSIRFKLSGARTHLLRGEAAPALREFASGNEYDVLIVGAPRLHPAPWPRPQSVAQALTGIGCDLLSVQDPEAGLHDVVGGRQGRRSRAFPLWQWIGAD